MLRNFLSLKFQNVTTNVSFNFLCNYLLKQKISNNFTIQGQNVHCEVIKTNRAITSNIQFTCVIKNVCVNSTDYFNVFQMLFIDKQF